MTVVLIGLTVGLGVGGCGKGDRENLPLPAGLPPSGAPQPAAPQAKPDAANSEEASAQSNPNLRGITIHDFDDHNNKFKLEVDGENLGTTAKGEMHQFVKSLSYGSHKMKITLIKEDGGSSTHASIYLKGGYERPMYFDQTSSIADRIEYDILGSLELGYQYALAEIHAGETVEIGFIVSKEHPGVPAKK